MKLLIHLVVWMGWILLACLIIASALELRKPIEAKPDQVLQWALPITAVIGVLTGLAALHLRHHLFWIRRKIDIEDGGGRAIFLGFTIAAMTGAGMAFFACFATRFLHNSNNGPILGICVGLLFLVLLFPRLPK